MNEALDGFINNSCPDSNQKEQLSTRYTAIAFCVNNELHEIQPIILNSQHIDEQQKFNSQTHGNMKEHTEMAGFCVWFVGRS